jgi:hypothetical protein
MGVAITGELLWVWPLQWVVVGVVITGLFM